MNERQIVLAAMQRRPNDLWPRGEGHVLLGVPGEPTAQKAYHEPGGSLSPAPGSFGVSLWIVDSGGAVVASSDTLPMAQIAQRYDWPREAAPPSLETRTPFYRCRWSRVDDGLSSLELDGLRSDPSVQVAIRSVGPAGGPLERVSWDGGRLRINHRWVVECAPAPIGVHLGSEEELGWMRAAQARPSHADREGWGYARLVLDPGRPATLRIRDTAPQFRSPLTYDQVKSGLDVTLPDVRFAASLDAQAANLMMGLLGKQTCPGEPVNYPLAWERDGAYTLMAMARCGQRAVARELSRHFAENDFFGGFGAEGDAPGSAISALVEVATILDDPEFEAWLWPHVERKAALIGEMQAAEQPIEKEWIGPIVPAHVGKAMLPVICQARRGDLIAGNMDLHFPILYINAVSYRGLKQAAKLATRLSKTAEAARFEERARVLQRAWSGALATDEARNERTYMSSLWPSWVAARDPQSFLNALTAHWQHTHDAAGRPLQRPLWTYFEVAQAHQWLYLGEPGRVWQALSYFWENQSSPGLYTYWEGNGEENAFGGWEQIRGWVAPRAVTPHYWTAAEMLLLQLDMLAYVSENEEQPGIVVGAGLPEAWLSQPMRVRHLHTSLGRVDWSYADGKLEVDVFGPADCPVSLAPGLRKWVTLEVRRNDRTRD